MDHVNHFLLVEHENDLEEPPASTPAEHEPFVLFDPPGIGLSCSSDDDFGFLGRDTVLGDGLAVPRLPAEIHELLMQENPAPVNRMQVPRASFLFRLVPRRASHTLTPGIPARSPPWRKPP